MSRVMRIKVMWSRVRGKCIESCKVARRIKASKSPDRKGEA